MVKTTRLNSLDYDSEWRVCGVHVEYAAFVVALAGIGVDIIALLLALYASKYFIAVIVLFFLIINSTVLCAKGKRHRFCYCPYLVSNVFGILMSLAMAILMIYFLSELPEWWNQWVDPIPDGTPRTDKSIDKVIWTTSVLLIFFVVYFLLYAFFQYVIWKAYRFMKRYPHGDPATTTITTHAHDQGRLITTAPIATTGPSIVTVEEQQTVYTKKI